MNKERLVSEAQSLTGYWHNVNSEPVPSVDKAVHMAHVEDERRHAVKEAGEEAVKNLTGGHPLGYLPAERWIERGATIAQTEGPQAVEQAGRDFDASQAQVTEPVQQVAHTGVRLTKQ